MKYALVLSLFALLSAGYLSQRTSDKKLTAKTPVTSVKLRPQLRRRVAPVQAFGGSEPAMQQAWYEYGTSRTLPPITTTKNEFVVVASTPTKARDFVSSSEQWLRQQSLADTTYPNSTSLWKELMPSRKRVKMARQQLAYRQQANSLHAVNNQAHYLIWLLNNSASPAILGTQDGSVFCVLQALDKNQQWRPVQYWHFSGCGNSYSTRYLRPGENLCLLAQMPQRGSFKTKLRYKLAGVQQFYYSGVFDGHINYSEFTEPSGYYQRSATRQRVPDFKLDSLPHLSFGRKQAFPFHQGTKRGESLPY